VWHRRKTVIHDCETPTPCFANNPTGTFSYPGSYGDILPHYYKGKVETLANWTVLSGSLTSVPPNWAITATVSDETSVINDVIEKADQLKADILLNLIEANQAWPAIKSMTSLLDITTKRKWKAIRQLVRRSSGTYLAWKFGIAPIISDMTRVQKSLPQLRQQFSKHIEQKPFRASKVVPYLVNYVPYADVQTQNGYEKVSHPNHGEVLIPPSVRYVLVVRPVVRYETAFFQTLDYFLAKYATSPASLIWEKIPFSFIVDWFVDLRGTLRAIDKSVGYSPYEIISFTRSYSYALKTYVERIHRSPCDGTQLLHMSMGNVEYRHYERSVVSSAPIGPVLRPRFGKSQAGISAALISQKLSTMGANLVPLY
jgi:hypothetical protein